MIGHPHRQAVITTLAVLICAPLVHAGAVVDLASEGAPFISGARAEEAFGHCTALGDLDGDGELELVVGAPGLADSAGGAHIGGVFVFAASLLDTLSSEAAAANLARWTLVGARDHGRFGAALVVRDFDGDGFDDLAVAAPDAGEGSNIARGEVSVFFGGPGGSWTLGPGAPPELVLRGTTAGAGLGSALLAADVDGDGTAELLIAEPGGGAAGAGVVYLLHGTALRSVYGAAGVSDVATGAITGEAAGDALAGLSVTDTDGDGAPELALGAGQADGPGTDLPDAGRVYVLPARPLLDGLSVSLPLDGTVVISGVTARGFLGPSISTGDVDYDGIDDLLVSAYASMTDGQKLEATGEAFLLFGNRAPVAGERSSETGAGLWGAVLDDASVPRFTGGSRSDLFGLPVLLTDLNGDGADDIVFSAQYADGPDGDRNACGEVYVYWGSLRSVMLAKAGAADLADVTIAGASPEDSIGGSLLVRESDDDGPPSLVIGAPNASVASAGGDDLPRCGKLILVSGELLLR